MIDAAMIVVINVVIAMTAATVAATAIDCWKLPGDYRLLRQSEEV